jgi:RNA polymerase sigma factor (sigma-70 family)
LFAVATALRFAGMNKGLSSTSGASGKFGETRWSHVARAAQENVDSPEVHQAVEELYRAYSQPVYSFIRRRGRSRHDAQDLTQDFFIHLLEKKTLSRADPERGKFRTFLLGALQRFLADKADYANAKKRGGGSRIIFLDDDTAEQQYQLAAPDSVTAEELFQRRWAASLIGLAMLRLKEDMNTAGKGRLFDALQGMIIGAADAPQQEIADQLGVSVAVVRTTIHRLRSRYRELLREEVLRTVADPKDIETEMKELRTALLG